MIIIRERIFTPTLNAFKGIFSFQIFSGYAFKLKKCALNLMMLFQKLFY